jgi:hypothetical protein
MVSILLLAVVLAAGYAAWRVSPHSPRPADGWPKLWELACLIGAVRIGALWLGLAGLRSPGRAQAWGYLLLMVDLPDLYLAASARSRPIAWAVIGTLVLAATSFIWAAMILWFVARMRPAVIRG